MFQLIKWMAIFRLTSFDRYIYLFLQTLHFRIYIVASLSIKSLHFRVAILSTKSYSSKGIGNKYNLYEFQSY